MDSTRETVSGVRADTSEAYDQIPELLQRYISKKLAASLQQAFA